MERISYGATAKYYPNPSLGLGTGRQQHAGPPGGGGGGPLHPTLKKQKQEPSLIALNPFSSTLGLQPKDFSPTQLCAAAAAAWDAEQGEHQLLDAKTPAATPGPAAGGPSDGDGGGAAPAEVAGHPAMVFVEDDSDDEGGGGGTGSEGGGGEGDAPPPQQQRQRQAGEEAAPAVPSGVGDGSSSGSESRSGSELSGDSGGSTGSAGADAAEGQQEPGFGSEEEEVGFIPLLAGLTPARPEEPAAGAAGHAGEGRREPGYRPPWLPRLARFGSPLLRLHNEVVAFAAMLAPTAEESESRARSMRAVREVVASIWPGAEVQVFGSYETGLYTPASDTDVVVVNTSLNNPATGLKALAQALMQRQLVRNMQQVLTARVPIIKFEMVESGLAFDVSWEVRSGPQGAAVVRRLLEQWPVLKPLVLVLKVFLTQRELNEVYSGGIGSYSLIIMVAAFLQMHASRRPAAAAAAKGGGRKRGRPSGAASEAAGALEGNLGLLLVDFFRLYGRALNVSDVGVSCTNGGRFYSKRHLGFLLPDRPWLLSVQDPLDAANDTARNSWNVKTVRQVFDHAYQLLTSPCGSGESLLGRIIHLAPVVAGRPVPAWFHEAPGPALGSRHSSGGGRQHRTPSGHAGAGGGGSSGGGKRARERGGRDDSRERKRRRSSSGGGKGGGSGGKGNGKGGDRQGASRRQSGGGGGGGKGGGKGGGSGSSRKDKRREQESDDRPGRRSSGGHGGGGRDHHHHHKHRHSGSHHHHHHGHGGHDGGGSSGRDAGGRAGKAAASSGGGQGGGGDRQHRGQAGNGSRSDTRSPSRKRQRR